MFADENYMTIQNSFIYKNPTKYFIVFLEKIYPCELTTFTRSMHDPAY